MWRLMLFSLKHKINIKELKSIKRKENFVIIPKWTFVDFRNYSQNKPIKCWNCGLERDKINELFCEKCNIIQNPTEKNNYFKIFSIEENFDLDLKELQSKYRAMQSLLHPDKFAQKSTEEKEISEEFSSLVNKGYNILSSPLSRALHLLHLSGENLLEEEKTDNPEFLMEIMELNEEIENANSEENIRKLHEKHKQITKEIIEELKQNFKENDIKKAKENLIKMRYYNSVGMHINNLLRDKGIVD